jgi:hypothetical protein
VVSCFSPGPHTLCTPSSGQSQPVKTQMGLIAPGFQLSGHSPSQAGLSTHPSRPVPTQLPIPHDLHLRAHPAPHNPISLLLLSSPPDTGQSLFLGNQAPSKATWTFTCHTCSTLFQGIRWGHAGTEGCRQVSTAEWEGQGGGRRCSFALPMLSCGPGQTVVCGTPATGLPIAEHGNHSHLHEMKPFLIWT